MRVSPNAPRALVSSGNSATIVALGNIVPGNAVIHLNAPASSGELKIQSLLVHVNDRVKAQQILGTLESIGRFRAAVAVANAQVSSSRASLDKVLAGNSSFQIASQSAAVERLRAEFARQVIDIKRYDELHREGIISDSDWEVRSVGFQQASASLRDAQATLKQLSEVRPVDVDVAKTKLMSEQAELQSAQANLEQAYIRAPEDGTVLHIYTWPGERVGDQGVLDLASTGDTFVDAEVYETDLSRVRLGQAATVTAQALDHPLHGTITLIERVIGRQLVVNTDPAANTDGRVSVVRVRLDSESKRAAEQLINLQVRVEFQP